MARPWLSVIMPTCDGGRYLRNALDSIVEQGDKSIEVIVVDDGSRDDTLTIAERYRAAVPLRIEALRHLGNWAANANHCMRLARGEYLSILHQDDAWDSKRLAVLKRLVSIYREAALFVHPCWYMDSLGRKIGYWRCPFPRTASVIAPQRALERLLVQCLYGMPGAFVPRHAGP